MRLRCQHWPPRPVPGHFVPRADSNRPQCKQARSLVQSITSAKDRDQRCTENEGVCTNVTPCGWAWQNSVRRPTFFANESTECEPPARCTFLPPGTELAGVQPAGVGPGARSKAPAAGAGEVLLHLQFEPGRVLRSP